MCQSVIYSGLELQPALLLGHVYQIQSSSLNKSIPFCQSSVNGTNLRATRRSMFNTLRSLFTLSYPITRPITLGLCFNIPVIILGVAWVTIITTISVAAVGYELVPFTSTLFNSSYTLWYEVFIPEALVRPARNCEGSIIKGQGGK